MMASLIRWALLHPGARRQQWTYHTNKLRAAAEIDHLDSERRGLAKGCNTRADIASCTELPNPKGPDKSMTAQGPPALILPAGIQTYIMHQGPSSEAPGRT